MKKNVCYLFSLMAMCLFLFSACSSNSPAEAAKKYANYLKNGDFDKWVDGVAFGEDASETNIKAGKAMLLAMMEAGKEKLKEKGGVKDIETVSETISEDGKTAKVVLKMTYGDGTSEDSSMDMIQEKGTWKMHMKK